MYNKKMQENLIKNMNEKLEILYKDELEQIIKAIPEDNIVGGIDPREKEALLGFVKFSSGNLNNEKPSLEKLRVLFGSKNIDISENILINDIKILGRDNNEILLKVYEDSKIEIKPAFIFIHGGGFFAGSTDVVGNACKYLAQKSGAKVFSVDYRLAPEHKFPLGLNDCYDSLLWIYKNAKSLNINKEKIGIGGDSAGGNLATVVSLLDRVNNQNIIKFQALLYPCVLNVDKKIEDYKFDLEKYEYGNDKELAKKLVLMIKSLPEVGEYYVDKQEDLESELISPLLSDKLNKMPKTLIITGEYDYLTLESEAYARKLIKNGVKVKYIKYKGVSHAIIDKIGKFPQAQDCLDEISEYFLNS